MGTVGFNVKFKSEVNIVRSKVTDALEAASNELKEKSIEWVQEKMLYGYHDPHGPDGHTEIVDTGATFDSVDADTQRNSQDSYTVKAGVQTDYAVYVHNGTRKLKGRPFLRDAMMEHVSDIESIMKKHMND